MIRGTKIVYDSKSRVERIDFFSIELFAIITDNGVQQAESINDLFLDEPLYILRHDGSESTYQYPLCKVINGD